MRRAMLVLLCSALSVNAGCSTIRDEVRYPGGAPGRVLDSRTFDASRSKQLQLLRATLAIAIAARIGEGVMSPEDGDAFARQLAEASREVNYAAADAGFPVYVDGQQRTACTIGTGTVRGDLPPTPAPTPTPSPSASPAPSPYALEDAQCIGYFTNFESNMARIESRVVRAMLTALPAERAREFLENLTKGDLMSALWSFAQASGDVAGAFHRGSGAYRSGVETLAAATPTCEFDPAFDRALPATSPTTSPTSLTRFDERYDTVIVAAACLNLSPRDLFDDEDIAALKLPDYVPPKAFHALFRIARSACVGIPLLNAPNDPAAVIESMGARREYCDRVRFEPRERPHALKDPDEATRSSGQQQQPDNPRGRPDEGGGPRDSVPAGAEAQQNRNPARELPPLPQPSA